MPESDRNLDELVLELQHVEAGRSDLVSSFELSAGEATTLLQGILPASVVPLDASLVAEAVNRLTNVIEAVTAPPQIAAGPPPPLETWASIVVLELQHVEAGRSDLVKLFGHRQIIGFVQEDELAGRGVLAIKRLRKANRPPGVAEPHPPLELEERARVYSPAAIYSFEAITETEARERWLDRNPHDDDIPF